MASGCAKLGFVTDFFESRIIWGKFDSPVVINKCSIYIAFLIALQTGTIEVSIGKIWSKFDGLAIISDCPVNIALEHFYYAATKISFSIRRLQLNGCVVISQSTSHIMLVTPQITLIVKREGMITTMV